MDDEPNDEREKQRTRLSIVEGHLAAFDRWAEFTVLFLNSPDERSVVNSLQLPPFGFSELVASYLVGTLSLKRATAAGRREFEAEAAELRRLID